MYLYHGPICHLVTDGYVTCQPSVKLHRLRCLGKVSDTRAEICYMSEIRSKGNSVEELSGTEAEMWGGVDLPRQEMLLQGAVHSC